MHNSIVIDLDYWNTDYEIINEIEKAISQYPNKIYIVGNTSKWIQLMRNNEKFALNCLIATFKKMKFIADGGHNRIYSIYSANIFNSNQKISYKIVNKIFELKRQYTNLDSFILDVKLKFPNLLLKLSKFII